MGNGELWEQQAAWKAAGLCMGCGAAWRIFGGGTKWHCPACSARDRERRKAALKRRREIVAAGEDGRNVANEERRKARTARRKAERLCVICGARLPEGEVRVNCAGCLRRVSGRRKRRLERARLAAEAAGKVVVQWSVGMAVPTLEGGRFSFRLGLDREAADALQSMVAAYREGEKRAGRKPLTHPVSQLVRAAVRVWGEWRCPAREHPMATGRGAPKSVVEFVCVTLDAECWRIVNRDARWRGGKSEAMRGMIVAGRPRIVGVGSGGKVFSLVL